MVSPLQIDLCCAQQKLRAPLSASAVVAAHTADLTVSSSLGPCVWMDTWAQQRFCNVFVAGQKPRRSQQHILHLGRTSRTTGATRSCLGFGVQRCRSSWQAHSQDCCSSSTWSSSGGHNCRSECSSSSGEEDARGSAGTGNSPAPWAIFETNQSNLGVPAISPGPHSNGA